MYLPFVYQSRYNPNKKVEDLGKIHIFKEKIVGMIKNPSLYCMKNEDIIISDGLKGSVFMQLRQLFKGGGATP